MKYVFHRYSWNEMRRLLDIFLVITHLSVCVVCRSFLIAAECRHVLVAVLQHEHIVYSGCITCMYDRFNYCVVRAAGESKLALSSMRAMLMLLDCLEMRPLAAWSSSGCGTLKHLSLYTDDYLCLI